MKKSEIRVSDELKSSINQQTQQNERNSRQNTMDNEIQEDQAPAMQHQNQLNQVRLTPASEKKLKIIKGTLVGVVISFLCLNDSVTWFLPTEKVVCLEDGIEEFLKPVNTFFADNSGFKNGLLIATGIILDILMLISLALWTMYGKSWRYPFALASEYLLAFIMKQLFKMAYPPNYIWEFPGVYSLTLHYGNANTFFYVASIGLCMINFLELRDNKYFKLAWCSFAAMVLLIFLCLVLQGQWFIDIFGSVCMSHFFWIYCERISWIFDYKVLRIPFHKKFPDFRRQCGRCKVPINKLVNIEFDKFTESSKDGKETLFNYSYRNLAYNKLSQ